MKLLLIQPFRTDYLEFRQTTPPLGLATINAAAKNIGFKTTLVDLEILFWHEYYGPQADGTVLQAAIELNSDAPSEQAKKRLWNTVLHHIDVSDADVIGISLPQKAYKNSALFIATQIKNTYPEKKIIFGGHIVHSEDISTFKGIVDYLALEKGIAPLQGIYDHLNGKEITQESGSDKSVNLIVMDEQQEFATKDISFEDEPMPDFQGLPLELYSPNFHTRDICVLPYFFIKGCRGGCTFCNPMRQVISKTPQKVATELQELSHRYHTNTFFFLNFAINESKAYLKELQKEFRKRDMHILWSDSATIREMDEETLDILYDLGCRKLTWGMESASNNILRLMNKGYNVEKAERILRYSHKIGIWNYVNFITGFIHETEEDFAATISFIREYSEYLDMIDPTPFHLLNESILGKRPELFNIRILSKDAIEIQKNMHESLPYDEIGGYRWGEKRAVIFERQKKLISLFPEKVSGVYTDILLYAYDRFHDKRTVNAYVKNLEKKGESKKILFEIKG